MNPRRFRYCLLAAALAVAFWRSPVASSTFGSGEDSAQAIDSSEPAGGAVPAPPALPRGRDSAAATSVR